MLFVTCAVVAFTIIGQGLTIQSVIATVFPPENGSRGKAT